MQVEVHALSPSLSWIMIIFTQTQTWTLRLGPWKRYHSLHLYQYWLHYALVWLTVQQNLPAYIYVIWAAMGQWATWWAWQTILQWSWASLSSVAFLQHSGQMPDSEQHNMFLWLNKWPYSFTVCLSLPRYAAPLDSPHTLRNVSATWMGPTFPRNATLHIELEQSINPKCSCSSQFWSQIQCQIHLCPLWMGRRCCRQPLSMSLQGKTTPISPRVTTLCNGT